MILSILGVRPPVRHTATSRTPATTRHRARAAAVGTGLALGLVLTGACGGGDDKADKSSSSPTASGNGLADKTPQEILTAVTAAVKQATSVHMKGSMTEGNQKVTIDMRIGTDRAQGTITGAAAKNPSASIELICVGGQEYVKGRAFFESAGADAAQMVGDKWAMMPTEGGNANPFAPFCSVTSMADNVLKPSSTPSKSAPTTVNGQPVVTLTDADGGAFYAASTGTPYVVRISDSEQQQENVDFTEWNAPLQITAPTDTVDMTWQ